MATLYIAMTEAVRETFGRDIEPAVNRIIGEMMQHLPEDAQDMCAYLLEFATREEAPQSIDWARIVNHHDDASSAVH